MNVMTYWWQCPQAMLVLTEYGDCAYWTPLSEAKGWRDVVNEWSAQEWSE